jgi:predicted ATPase
MDYIEIEGYKSIKKLGIELKPVNILIGANGAGKSNFISFFEFLNQLYEQKLKGYVALNGGLERVLFGGRKKSKALASRISFNESVNEYSFKIEPGDDSFIFVEEGLWYEGDVKNIARYEEEAFLKYSKLPRADYIRDYLKNLMKYHFHDTGKNSPFNQLSHVENDTYFLYETGSNLAAILFDIRENNRLVYRRIIKTIQSIAPYFSDFFLEPNKEGYVRLQWRDLYNSTIYGANDLSDGTMRFIALATLFLQPSLPKTLIIDEPELGLHPNAISKLCGMIQSAVARGSQVILATQSTDLVSYFMPEDVVTVDQENGESIFSRLNEKELSLWLKDYSLGELWKRNIIHKGQP